MNLFKELATPLQKPVKILDIGGTVLFWEMMGFISDDNYEVTILNLSGGGQVLKNITTVEGDATDLREYMDKEFDVVFSNSVIEHVGDYEDQVQMANEVLRVGKRYFLQTPNYYFPFEPHFLCPCFHFFPLCLKVSLIRHFNLGWRKKTPEKEKAIEVAKSVRLLRKKELEVLFPDCEFYNERLFGLVNSYVVYGGW